MQMEDRYQVEMKRKIDVSNPNGQDDAVNMFTGKPYSKRYYDILKGREGTSSS